MGTFLIWAISLSIGGFVSIVTYAVGLHEQWKRPLLGAIITGALSVPVLAQIQDSDPVTHMIFIIFGVVTGLLHAGIIFNLIVGRPASND